MNRIKKLLFAFAICVPLAAMGVFLFKTLDARQGLTSSQVNCILKDSRGFVWLGTPAGLYRYDGYVFKNYQSNSQDGSTLPDSYILSIQEALDGNLWVETTSGYCIYHPQTETFERDMKQVLAQMGIEGEPNIVYIDRHKNLWAAIPNKGVVAYNMQQQLLHEFGYTNDSHGVPQGNICSISECRDGAILVYDDGRLVCCDVMHQVQTIWSSDYVSTQHLRKTPSLRAYTDQTQNIWLYGQGTLFIYNRNTNEWNTTFGDQLGLSGISVDHSVNSITGDRNGNIWIGTDHNGLLHTNINNHELESIQPRNLNDREGHMETVGIRSLYVDDTDLLWVGTEKSGIAFCGNNIYKFESLLNGDITAITQDADGNMWYGTSDNGVVGFEGSLASKKTTCMETTPDGSLWVGSRQNGLTRIKNGTSTIYSTVTDSMNTIIDDHINALSADKAGNLWIATNGGLQVFNPKMNSFSSYTRENGKLSTNNITALFYAPNNIMLVGTAEGLVMLNLSTTEKKVYTGNSTNIKQFTSNYVTQVIQDSRGLIWVGTREGINILNLEDDDLDYLTKKQGLTNNSVCGLAEDKNHNIWVTTSNGVTRVVVQRNHETGKNNYGLYNYDTSDGLQGNEFNVGSIYTKSDGNVIFGGLYGINWVRQHTKEDTESLPRVMLTQLYIGEEEILTGHSYRDRVILPQALNESNRIELDNSQNTFSIKFSTGNYNQSEKLLFMYWMEGLDDDWRNGDALNHGVTFTDLSSGKYILHVKAVSAEGAVSNQERTLEIQILRPWWMSWWMIVIYVIFIALVLFVWFYGFKRLKDIWQRKKNVIDQLKRQREEIKQTSDELRMPMARMTSIIGELAEKEESLEGREQLNSLHFQMLQVITRISEMQSTLENPEAKAVLTVNERMGLNDKGEVSLPQIASDELTYEIKPRQLEATATSKKFIVVFVDDNEAFLGFIHQQLQNIYDLRVYNNITIAAEDIKVMMADLVICKQDMLGMTGSELCNMIKTNPVTERTKFILMTDSVLTPQDMKNQNITLAADDMLAKPFNIQEAVMRFNKVLGIAPIELDHNVIEGGETRMLESQNSSMTTSTFYFDESESKVKETTVGEDIANKSETSDLPIENAPAITTDTSLSTGLYGEDETLGDYSMSNIMDQQLMRNVEQYVIHNMSRGSISLDEMANAMGMGRVPFFHKIRAITTKTPTEVVRDLRLKHACTLLVRTNINMNELASNVGFMTAENFASIFKEKFGITPLEYRLRHRKE
uniref:DNA-binding sensor histidine kinase/response regulator n=1 Tax=uncultured bacterium Contig196 TaxID=1393527 RepID=W0FK13_9BACT|nr:DNA-binding sensor histidine kinase/response regulator [uncultured bacterium Contig196]